MAKNVVSPTQTLYLNTVQTNEPEGCSIASGALVSMVGSGGGEGVQSRQTKHKFVPLELTVRLYIGPENLEADGYY